MLSDRDILKQIVEGGIVIIPFNKSHLNPNSYDVTLHDKIIELVVPKGRHIDPKLSTEENIKKGNLITRTLFIQPYGLVLQPNSFYLGSTNEYTESMNHAPMLEGKSSLARLGLEIHRTAGFGDVGFKGQWTLEMTVAIPMKVYKGMKIGQLSWLGVSSPVIRSYDKISTSKYNGQIGATLSKYHQNFK